MKAYVVSCRGFTDRHMHMARIGEAFNLELEYIWEYDANDLTRDDLDRCSPELQRASISNVLKHLEAHRRILDSGDPFGLVLEDDVILFQNFCSLLPKIIHEISFASPGWLVFLGGADNRIDPRFVGRDPWALLEKNMSTAEAYLVDQKSCERRLEWLNNSEFKIDKQADHLITYVDNLVATKHYWPSIPLATQASITGGLPTRLDKSRSKKPSIYLWLRYKFNVLRKQLIPRFIFNFRAALDQILDKLEK